MVAHRSPKPLVRVQILLPLPNLLCKSEERRVKSEKYISQIEEDTNKQVCTIHSSLFTKNSFKGNNTLPHLENRD